MNSRSPVAFAAVCLLCAAQSALAAPATLAQPVSRAFAESPQQARAFLKDQPRRPAPSTNVLSASIGPDGRIVTHCGSDENPAFRAWSERLHRNGQQER